MKTEELGRPIIDADCTLCPECGKQLLIAHWGKGGDRMIIHGMYDVKCKNGHEFYQPLKSDKLK